jgi:carboxyl-terminal processing protease
MKQIIRIVFIIAIALFLLTSAFGAGLFMGGSGLFQPGVVRAEEQPAEFDVFWQVWNIVHNHFVDRTALNNTSLTYGAINGLINALGDEGHTRFLTPQEAERQRTDISGTFYGIGASVGIKDKLPVIIAPLEDSPAEKAGIKAGDIILEVNGEDVTTLPINDVVDRIRGEEGTPVDLTIFRPDTSESLEFTIIRGEVKLEAATWAMVPGSDVAVIRLNQFSANLNDEMIEAIKAAKLDGAARLVIDVRNNPGGLLDQAVEVTSQFLTEGNVLIQEDADGNRETFPVKEGGFAPDIPIVVLINRGSASAAEIFAGAIQDHKRGQIVGETTFGTGTVLQPFRLEDGSALLLGTSQWLTPEGRLIRKNGIEPDVEVEMSIAADVITPSELKEMTRAELLESEDVQLLKALEIMDVVPQTAVE